MKLCCALLFVGAVLVVSDDPAGAYYPLRTIALSNETAPNSTRPFGTVLDAALNERGDVAFTSFEGQLKGAWLSSGGQLRSIARSDDPVPGIFQANWSQINDIQIDESGRVAFSLGAFIGYGDASRVDWLAYNSGVPPGAFIGQRLPYGTSPAGFSLSEGGSLSVRFDTSRFTGSGFWTNRTGAVETLYDNEVHFLAGHVHHFVTSQDPHFVTAADGSLAFTGVLTDGNDASPNRSGIFSDRGGQLSLLAEIGKAAFAADGSLFARFGRLRENANGMVAFAALTSDIGGSSSAGLWAENGDGGLRPIAVAGQLAPGLDGYVFDDGYLIPTANGASQHPFLALNDLGRAAFFATAVPADPSSAGQRVSGFWSEGRTGVLELVATMGFPVQSPPGRNIGQLTPYQAAMNAAGQIATTARIDGPSNQIGLVATDVESGVLNVLVKTGDTVPVTDNSGNPSLRVVSRLELVGDDFFNDRGDLLFRASFTDGASGLFVVTVPEPAGVVLAALFLWARLPSARRRPVGRAGPCT